MVRDRKPLLSSMDVGDWARHYASRPYGHHKAEVYELFVDILSCLPDGADVLDVGAGPGHLAHEFYGRNPETGVGFVLLDASVEMLKIAAERLAGRRVETVHRSFNMAGWSDGVGPFDAIVSNNSLFHVHPENLEAFYRTCYGLLKRDGLLLNQQSLAWEEKRSPYGDDAFAAFMQRLPETILPALPRLTDADRERLVREKEEAGERHTAAIKEAKSAGVEFAEGQTGYQFLTVETHLGAMRRAGFAAGCIWRKREFALLCGTKGEPLAAHSAPRLR